jgi:uncharacterized membrane protein YgcG
MKAWTWVLLFVAALLFLWSISREGFRDTIALRGPPYGNEDYKPIVENHMPATLVKTIETAKSLTKPVKPIQQTGRPAPTASEMATYNADLLKYQGKLVDGTISDVMGDFHTTVYQPATTPLSTAKVDTFLTTHATSGFRLANKADIKTLLVSYFVNQSPGEANGNLLGDDVGAAFQQAARDAAARAAAAAANSGYADTLDDVGQTAGYSSPSGGSGSGGGGGGSGTGTTPSPTCPSGYTLSADKKTCTGTTATDTKTPTCVTGYTYAAGACTLTPSSTGGSSTFLTSNSGGNKGNIWGPAFSGLGNNSGPGAISGGPRDYPTLLGPKPKESTMVDGAGIVNPSQHQTLVAGLPSAAGTGSDPNSQFFGSSRVPGDKDLFPNPYVEFTPSTGSSKTEPVPFLSDFSAFFR